MYSHVYDALYAHYDYLNAIYCTNDNSFWKTLLKHLSKQLFTKKLYEFLKNIKEKISRDAPRKGR